MNRVGNISKEGKDRVQVRVASLHYLINVIIPHFDKYPLITQKNADFILFKKVVDLINCGEHLTIDGLKKILAIRASINWGLTAKLKAAFPEIVPAERLFIQSKKIFDPWWLAGFTSGEGCFYIKISKSKTHKLGLVVQLIFKIAQHSKDEQLIKYLITYLGCGIYVTRSKDKNVQVNDYVVTRLSDIINIVIPFFDKYKIVGVKSLDFADLKKVAELMHQNEAHLNPEGLKKICQIKSRMNDGRCKISNDSILRSASLIQSLNNKIYYSTTTTNLFNKKNLNNNISFNEWLSGLIDGDGHFQLTKKGFANLKIILHINDKKVLYVIKHKFGGSVKEISNSNALKYKLQNSKGLIDLINSVNGLIRNPVRMIQLNKICVKYNIKLKEPQPLTYYNGGCVYRPCWWKSNSTLLRYIVYTLLFFILKILFNIKVELTKGILSRPLFSNASNQYITASHKGFSTLSPAKNSTTGTMRHFNYMENLKECPYWVTGFVDGEGSFMINIRKASNFKLGLAITPTFQIEVHKKDVWVLRLIQDYLGGIGIVKNRKTRNSCVFLVRSLNQIITQIIPHFDKYPLITQKRSNYLLFKEVILMMERKEHLTMGREGLQRILENRASMNWGLTDQLKVAFPHIIPGKRPLIDNKKNARSLLISRICICRRILCY